MACEVWTIQGCAEARDGHAERRRRGEAHPGDSYGHGVALAEGQDAASHGFLQMGLGMAVVQDG